VSGISIPADPYRWPFDGSAEPDTLAIVVIDMQTDFCGKGGYIDAQGIDLSATRGAIAPIAAILEAARRIPEILVIHTREGHRPELVDLPENKRWRSERVCPGIGELAPAHGEIVIDKPGKGAFFATDLEHVLRTTARTRLVLCGITTDVCVHTTLREANDRGFECLVVSDGTGATQPEHHAAALTMISMQGGIFGTVATSTAVVDALEALHA